MMAVTTLGLGAAAAGTLAIGTICPELWIGAAVCTTFLGIAPDLDCATA